MHISLGDDSTDGTIQYTSTDLTLTPEAGGGVPYVAGSALQSSTPPPCSAITVPCGFVGPVNCDATDGSYKQDCGVGATVPTATTATTGNSSGLGIALALALAAVAVLGLAK